MCSFVVIIRDFRITKEKPVDKISSEKINVQLSYWNVKKEQKTINRQNPIGNRAISI